MIHQAIAAAYAGRGVAHLTFPQDVLSARADGNVASVETLQPRPEFAARCRGRRPYREPDRRRSVLFMCGAGCHGAVAKLKALSDCLKAPLIHSVKGQRIMPYDDPYWMGGMGIIGSKPVYNAVMRADLLLMVDYPNFPSNRPRRSADRRASRGARRSVGRTVSSRLTKGAAPGIASSTSRPIALHQQLPAPSATSPSRMRYSS